MECNKCSKRKWFDGCTVNHIGDRMIDGGVIVAKKWTDAGQISTVRYGTGKRAKRVEIADRDLKPDMKWLDGQFCKCN